MTGLTPVLASDRGCWRFSGAVPVSLGDGFMIVSVYSVLLGSTLDTSFVSVNGVFHILYVNWWIIVPEVDSRPALFLRLLGSTADTCSTSVYLAGLPGHDAPRAVFLRCPQAPDARHHGRYGQEGQSMTGAAVPQLHFLRSLTPLSLHSG